MSATASPSIGSTFSAVKRVMMRPDLNLKAEKALAKVRELEAARVEIEKGLDSLVAYCNDFEKREQLAFQTFSKTRSISDLDALIECRVRLGPAQQIAGTLSQELVVRDLAGKRFRESNPQFRQVLKSAAEARLEMCRKSLSEIRAQETKRLTEKGFDADEIEDSLEIKHSRREFEAAESLVNSIESGADESVWLNNVRVVLA